MRLEEKDFYGPKHRAIGRTGLQSQDADVAHEYATRICKLAREIVFEFLRINGHESIRAREERERRGREVTQTSTKYTGHTNKHKIHLPLE
jgi:hypothetical protein